MKKNICFTFLFAILSISIYAQSIPVTFQEIKERKFDELLQVQGTVEAVNIARVSPRVSGPIENIFVKEGDKVITGQTKLFVIDHLKLQKSFEIRKQEVVIARLALKEKEAQLKQISADYEKSKIDAKRARLLWEDKSISQDNYEKAQLKYKVSEANFEHINTLIDLTREQLAKAQIALTIAEKDYSDSTVFSPLTGTVSEKLQEPGEMASIGKPIVVVKDTEDVEVTAFLPAEFYHKVNEEKTEVKIRNLNNIFEEAKVTYKSSEISTDLRTFKIKCHTLNKSEFMVPGGLVGITLVLNRRTGLAVPTFSIVNRNGNKAIFIIKDNKAKLVEVKVGLENEGFTEITSDQLKSGDKVITIGQHMVNDGSTITLSNGVK
ncbi:MAG: efflux RND transporter periplasmic adaptor subunit [Candidatus Riflebacteria bacterium]|nr:efflux RND transporter periplasmic adaptor subunit [Candidatus Riflebacteria bacterium]